MDDTTKIVGGLKSFVESKKQDVSLLERIKKAKNSIEVNYLLGVGSKYEKVSDGTKKKWARAGAIRLENLLK